jgi:hypothetical protein
MRLEPGRDRSARFVSFLSDQSQRTPLEKDDLLISFLRQVVIRRLEL